MPARAPSARPHRLLTPLLSCLAGAAVLAAVPARAEPLEPQADPKAIVVSGAARFTVLTPRLLRLEWSADGQFEDRASLAFIRRKLPVPAFRVERADGELRISTDAVALRYREGSGRFTAENLSVTFTRAGEKASWRPGMTEEANLKGTTRTLDAIRGAIKLESGLVSRDGWVVIDDSTRPLLDGPEWPWVAARAAGDRQDWYFFGHGRDYKGALKDFTSVAGRIPMPPRYAFGYWWSRYWAYTDDELIDLVQQFEAHDVPLDVLVVDMDWHETFEQRWWAEKKDQAGERLGWTGHTWNKNFFPDPKAFLDWTEAKGLKVTLNLHPASGIQPHEAQYTRVARSMGLDPASQRYVPFDIVDPKFARVYLEQVIHPLEKQGVDFWWLDWQQWSTTKIPGVSPTFWLNYVFFTDMERQAKARPMLFHRWGGLGNHRYQIGFSGDAFSDWPSLAFQPYFTATAANVGYGYWSHDIGGHLPENTTQDSYKNPNHVSTPLEPELYTRWIQFGAFSPILRTHTTKIPTSERRIWAYPEPNARAMREVIHLRYALLPYLYSAARKAYDTGVSILRPMYYDWPEAEEAYRFKDQYQFGDDLIVAPVTSRADAATGLARKELWLPEGEWVAWFSGQHVRGPAVVTGRYPLDEIPVFVRAGAVVPMQPRRRQADALPVNPLVLKVFAGAAGSTRVYEDAGDSLGYQRNEFAFTPVVSSSPDERIASIEIRPVEGRYPGMPATRAYELQLPGVWPPSKVTADGKSVPYRPDGSAPGWRYEGKTLTTIVALPAAPVSRKLTVQLSFPESLRSPLLDGFAGRRARLENTYKRLSDLWPQDCAPESMVRLVQTGRRLTLEPTNAKAELEAFAKDYAGVATTIRGLRGPAKTLDGAIGQLD